MSGRTHYETLENLERTISDIRARQYGAFALSVPLLAIATTGLLTNQPWIAGPFGAIGVYALVCASSLQDDHSEAVAARDAHHLSLLESVVDYSFDSSHAYPSSSSF